MPREHKSEDSEENISRVGQDTNESSKDEVSLASSANNNVTKRIGKYVENPILCGDDDSIVASGKLYIIHHVTIHLPSI